ncbi:MAG: hypothetical protein ACRYFU_21410 [Janthinobacterium lividum]
MFPSEFELKRRFEHVGYWYDRQGTGMAVFFANRVFSDYAARKVNPGYYGHGIDSGVPLSGQPDRLAFVSPRFGVSYDVAGDGNTVVRGGWGAYRFAGSTSSTTARRSRAAAYAALSDQNKTPIGAFFQPDPSTTSAGYGKTAQNPENLGVNLDGTTSGISASDYRPLRIRVWNQCRHHGAEHGL